jgi:hypothetical protein
MGEKMMERLGPVSISSDSAQRLDWLYRVHRLHHAKLTSTVPPSNQTPF